MMVQTENEMLALGSQLAQVSHSPLIIYLIGQLGAGKTVFCRGFIKGLGFDGKVKSPTYSLVETYSLLKMEIHHFDFYRIQDPEELEYIGIREYFKARSICLIEWPELADECIPSPDITVKIGFEGDKRYVEFIRNSISGIHTVDKFLASIKGLNSY